MSKSLNLHDVVKKVDFNVVYQVYVQYMVKPLFKALNEFGTIVLLGLQRGHIMLLKAGLALQ